MRSLYSYMGHYASCPIVYVLLGILCSVPVLSGPTDEKVEQLFSEVLRPDGDSQAALFDWIYMKYEAGVYLDKQTLLHALIDRLAELEQSIYEYRQAYRDDPAYYLNQRNNVTASTLLLISYASYSDLLLLNGEYLNPIQYAARQLDSVQIMAALINKMRSSMTLHERELNQFDDRHPCALALEHVRPHVAAYFIGFEGVRLTKNLRNRLSYDLGRWFVDDTSSPYAFNWERGAAAAMLQRLLNSSQDWQDQEEGQDLIDRVGKYLLSFSFGHGRLVKILEQRT